VQKRRELQVRELKRSLFLERVSKDAAIKETEKLNQKIKPLLSKYLYHLHEPDSRIKFVSQPCLSMFLSAYLFVR